MTIPEDHGALARLLVSITDLHPDNDAKTRIDPFTEQLDAADLIYWSGNPRHPGWKLTEAGARIVEAAAGGSSDD